MTGNASPKVIIRKRLHGKMGYCTLGLLEIYWLCIRDQSVLADEGIQQSITDECSKGGIIFLRKADGDLMPIDGHIHLFGFGRLYFLDCHAYAPFSTLTWWYVM